MRLIRYPIKKRVKDILRPDYCPYCDKRPDIVAGDTIHSWSAYCGCYRQNRCEVYLAESKREYIQKYNEWASNIKAKRMTRKARV